VLDGPQGVEVRVGGRTVLNFCANNYLGLANDPGLVRAAQDGLARWGFGLSSVRFICGTQAIHTELEAAIARFLGTEDAILYTSCFDANGGLFETLLGEPDAVVSDALNHASIIDGIRLCRARRYRYEHRDMADLERVLQETRDARTRLIATDGVFSMDGDVAPLAEIVELKDRYGAALMVDDAHGAGVLGPEGRGAAHAAGVADRIEVQLGTFSKAFGVYGAYVAGGDAWIRHLVNACRPLVFSTGLPPAVVAGIDAAIDLVRGCDDRRVALRAKAETFRRALTAGELDTGMSTTQIVPVIVGSNERALALAAALRARGLLAVAIRPPTVPPGEARIRFSLMATHDHPDLVRAAAAIVEESNGL
jgi:glycine C-acetyltransferase